MQSAQVEQSEAAARADRRRVQELENQCAELKAEAEAARLESESQRLRRGALEERLESAKDELDRERRRVDAQTAQESDTLRRLE